MKRTPLRIAMDHLRHVAKAGATHDIPIGDGNIGFSLEETIVATIDDASTDDDGAQKLSQVSAGLGSTLAGGTGNDLLQGGDGNDLIDGNDGDDQLFGRDGDDRLFGGLGSDKLYGGAGGDLFNGGDGDGVDTASYYGAATGVGVYLWNITRNTGDATGDSYVAIEVIDGSTHDDTIEGSTGSDVFWGDAGHDLLKGGARADTLSGGAGNDRLYGGEGADHLDGGADLDVAAYADAASGVVVDLLDGSRNRGEADGDVLVSIEGVIGSSYADQLYGTHGRDSLYGGAGNDTLEGRGDRDLLDGGEGLDFASYADSSSSITVDLLNLYRNTGDAYRDEYVSIEGIIGSRFSDDLSGAAGNDYLHGGAGDDVLQGRAGGDTLHGGEGRDLVSFRDSSSVNVNLLTGIGSWGESSGDYYYEIEDVFGSRDNDTLYGSNGENRFSGWYGDDRLYGGEGNDMLEGFYGNDYLCGGKGADYLDGGADFDVAVYADATSGVVVDLQLRSRNAGDAEGDILISIEGVIGSSYADELCGTGRSDRLSGGAGDDQLEGRGYGDVLDGGEGRDYASYAGSYSGLVVDLLNTSLNTGDAVEDEYYSIEGVIGSSYSDNLSGTAGIDDLFGGAGDDVLQGRQGGDRLEGGEGFDFVSYWDASSGVAASLVVGGGSVGDASGDVFFDIEGLQGSNYGDLLHGNESGNTLYGWGGNDHLFGHAGNDYIEGGNGSDVISGGQGFDWLLGNAGADQFQFDTAPGAGGTSMSPQNVDTLADFNGAEGDRVLLNTNAFRGYDASGTPVPAFPSIPSGFTSALSNDMFVVGTHAASSLHRIVYDRATGSIYFDADGAYASNDQILFAKVAAGTALTAAHFQLYTL